MNLLAYLKKEFLGIRNPEELYKKIKNKLGSEEFVELFNNLNEEISKKSIIKYLLVFLIGMYGKDFINKTIELFNKDKEIVKINITDKEIIDIAIENYSKKYNINKQFLKNILGNETSYSNNFDKYEGNKLGDGGTSFGPGQVKLAIAKEIWVKRPEGDINNSYVNKENLLKDIDFNIRTMCKILDYYNYKFSYIKDTKERYKEIAQAYNKGYTGAKRIKKYGNYEKKSIKNIFINKDNKNYE